MTLPFAPLRRALFFFMVITTGALLLNLDQSMGADDMVVAVDKSTLLKLVGVGILALLAEIWRGQRSLYKITTGQGKQIAQIKGFIAGKDKGFGLDGGDGES